MDITNGDEICGRCLVNVNATTSIRAIKPNGDQEEAPVRDPRGLKLWAQARLYGDRCRFQVDATGDRFESVSTWHGDPVCAYHLWYLAEAELRGHR